MILIGCTITWASRERSGRRHSLKYSKWLKMLIIDCNRRSRLRGFRGRARRQHWRDCWRRPVERYKLILSEPIIAMGSQKREWFIWQFIIFFRCRSIIWESHREGVLFASLFSTSSSILMRVFLFKFIGMMVQRGNKLYGLKINEFNKKAQSWGTATTPSTETHHFRRDKR